MGDQGPQSGFAVALGTVRKACKTGQFRRDWRCQQTFQHRKTGSPVDPGKPTRAR